MIDFEKDYQIINVQGTKYFMPMPLKDDYIFHYLLSMHKIFEIELISFLMEYISFTSVVIDVGGHIGNHSIQFAKKAKKVFAFEPMELNCQLFEKNLLLNGIKNVKLFKIAVADVKCNLEVDKINSKLSTNLGAAFLQKSKNGFIPATTIDEVLIPILKDRVSVMKFDVEEMEYFALLGAIKIIKKFHPVIYTEIFRKRVGFKQKLENIRSILAPLGYKNYYKKEFSGDIWVVE